MTSINSIRSIAAKIVKRPHRVTDLFFSYFTQIKQNTHQPLPDQKHRQIYLFNFNFWGTSLFLYFNGGRIKIGDNLKFYLFFLFFIFEDMTDC